MEDEEDLCKINVGGKTFLTEKKTLHRFPETVLSDMDANSPYYRKKWNCYYFDRNPEVFQLVLEAYRSGRLHLSPNVCYEAIIEELDFWKLDINTILSPCCVGLFQEYEERRDALHKVYNDTVDECLRDGKVRKKMEDAKGRRLFRYKLWMFLERPNSSRAALAWTIGQIFLVYVCMIIYALMTSVYGKLERSDTSVFNMSAAEPGPRFVPYVIQVLDLVINCVFTVDIVVRVAVAPDRFEFVKLATTVVDIVCALCYWIYAILNLVEIVGGGLGHSGMNVRNIIFIITVFRLVKVIKLSSKYVQLRSLLLSLKYSVKEMLLINLSFSAVMFLFAVSIYYCEYRTPGTQLNDIPQAFWWALITMTTVGYGDRVPVTTAGHFVAGLCACTGIVLTGLAISTLTNNLNTYTKLTAQQQRAQKMIDRRVDPKRIRQEKKSSLVEPVRSTQTDGDTTVL